MAGERVRVKMQDLCIHEMTHPRSSPAGSPRQKHGAVIGYKKN